MELLLSASVDACEPLVKYQSTTFFEACRMGSVCTVAFAVG
jgi:hypothetical protein